MPTHWNYSVRRMIDAEFIKIEALMDLIRAGLSDDETTAEIDRRLGAIQDFCAALNGNVNRDFEEA